MQKQGAGAESGIETGGEAGTATGETGSEAALDQVLSTLAEAGKKLAKMVAEYVAIDAVFKVANAILEELTKDPKAHMRAIKLKELIDVLTKSSDLMQKLSDWLQNNASKEVKVKDYVVSLQGVLSKFIPQIGSVSTHSSLQYYDLNY